jgi:hypothetical protein
VTQDFSGTKSSSSKIRIAALIAFAATGVILFARFQPANAQDNPKLFIDEDVQAFDIAPNNAIVYAVPRVKAVKRLLIERDDISVATGPGKIRKIVEADKFMPFPPPAGYVVNSLAWSPDSTKIAVSMTLQATPPGYENKKAGSEDDRDENSPLPGIGNGKALALLDEDGREIKVAGSKTRFIEGAMDGAWLADGKTVVYLTGAGQYSIVRVRPDDGKAVTLFEGHTFNALVWDAKNNRAFALGDNLSLHGHQALVQLDLLHETVREIAGVENYQGSLSLSGSGRKIGYFEDGDTIDVIDTVKPSETLRVRAGFGRFAWGPDDRRVLLKRGPDDRSNILLWVGLYDGSFASILHDLAFSNFEIAPDGQTIAVTIPGKRALKVYPLQ